MRYVCIVDCFYGKAYNPGEIAEDYELEAQGIDLSTVPDHFMKESDYEKKIREQKKAALMRK